MTRHQRQGYRALRNLPKPARSLARTPPPSTTLYIRQPRPPRKTPPLPLAVSASRRLPLDLSIELRFIDTFLPTYNRYCILSTKTCLSISFLLHTILGGYLSILLFIYHTFLLPPSTIRDHRRYRCRLHCIRVVMQQKIKESGVHGPGLVYCYWRHCLGVWYMYEWRRDNEMDLYRYTGAEILGYRVAMATRKSKRRIIASKYSLYLIMASRIHTSNL
jgi:hypothetical protein